MDDIHLKDHEISVRVSELSEADQSFIYAFWLNNYRNSSRFAERIKNDIFFGWHKKIIEIILKKPTTTTLIAHVYGDPNLFLGFFVFEKRVGENVAHYIYTKKVFRGYGVGNRLFQESGIDADNFQCTHWTHPMNYLVQKIPRVVYNPYNL